MRLKTELLVKVQIPQPKHLFVLFSRCHTQLSSIFVKNIHRPRHGPATLPTQDLYGVF
jgi:hypothetical protein